MTATSMTLDRDPELIEDFLRYGNKKTTIEERAAIVEKWEHSSDPLAQRWIGIFKRKPEPGDKVGITHVEYSEWIDLIAGPATSAVAAPLRYACARCGEERCIVLHAQKIGEAMALTDAMRAESIERARKIMPLCNVCRQAEQDR